VTATGYVDWSQTATVSTGVTSALNPALAQAVGTITGKVTDIATRAPIVGATVSVGSVSTTTNSTGTYTLTVQAGFPTVLVRMTGYAYLNQPTWVNAGSTSTMNAAMTKNEGTISGKLVDSITNAPIVGARVSVGSIFTTTNAAGAFSFVVPAGFTTVTASANGYVTSSAYPNVTPGSSITYLPHLFRVRQ